MTTPAKPPRAPKFVPIARTARREKCKGSTCGKMVYWDSRYRFPVSADYPGSFHPTAEADGLGVSHYADCPDVAEFSGRSKAPKASTTAAPPATITRPAAFGIADKVDQIAIEVCAKFKRGRPDHPTLHRDIENAYMIAVASRTFRAAVAKSVTPPDTGAPGEPS